ncbi:MAG: hypothetical protein ACE5RI_07025, partial [Candidatus Nitrosomaritimum yanchengensis]
MIGPTPVFGFDDGFFWKFGSYPIDSSPAGTGKTNTFEIYDPNLDSNGNSQEQLMVEVKSKDSFGKLIEHLDILLTETNDDGFFSIDHMVFMEGDAEFDISQTVSIFVEDNCTESSDTDGNCDSDKIEELLGSSGQSVVIFSDTDSSGITIDLVETGPDTGIFKGIFSFSVDSSDSSNSILHVSEGDVITVRDQKTNSKTNGLILGDPDRFAIQAKVGGTVEVIATSSGSSVLVTDEATITEGKSGGRGTGGLIRPGLVADSSSNSGESSGCSECTPPTLGVNSNNLRLVENGFSYNDNPVDV